MMRARNLRSFSTGLAAFGAAATVALGLAGCAAGPANEVDQGESGESAPQGGGSEVTLIVHDSFPAEDFEIAASAATGYDVKVVVSGDGGELTSQLVLTQGAPVADAFFGVDNVFASRLIDHGVVAPFEPSDPLPARAAELSLKVSDAGDSGTASGGAHGMLPITYGATCINIDPAWFAEQGLAEPTSYEDLADERYRGLTTLLDPTASSTGASFLVGTVSRFSVDGFADYWSDLAANDVRIEQGWTEAYYGNFTQGGEGGTYPIVLSYSSSPAWTLTEDGNDTTTKALLDTCSSQVEYAGVLEGATNPEGAAAVVDYLLSREFQDTIADTMYVYPVDDEAYLPEDWQRFAPRPDAPHDVAAEEIGKHRDDWLKTWSEAFGL